MFTNYSPLIVNFIQQYLNLHFEFKSGFIHFDLKI